MRLVLAGASGFLGTTWRDHLARQGHEVVRLVRGEALSADESRWDPAAGRVDRAVVEAADVVANVAGASLFHWPLTDSYRRTFLSSRVDTTRTLAQAVADSDRRPALVVQGGVNGYGDRGAEVLTEDSRFDGESFMARVTTAWEDATTPAVEAGARVTLMRSGAVLDRRGGAMRPLLLQFRLGLGGPVGSGEQYFPTISLRDWVRAASWLATQDAARGAYNVSGPGTTTNADFGRHLGRLLHRPSLVRAPAWPIRAVAGDILSGLLLDSLRVEPAKLLDEGFVFEHPTLDDRLAAALE
ncbi:MAG: TIGR01777 family oxidoreductase [Nocardioidaceae bacterium]